MQTGQLLEFAAQVFPSSTRAGWRERGECYVRGLLDGQRKSIQPRAAVWGMSGPSRPKPYECLKQKTRPSLNPS